MDLSELIKQNTPGQSDGFPVGVPKSFSWYQGWNAGGQMTPPTGFTAVEGWGQVYPKESAPANSNPNAAVEVAGAKTFVRSIQTGKWILVQDQSKLQMTGGHFVSDFAGNAAIVMKTTPLPDGSISFGLPPPGYNNHFWYKARGTYPAGTVDAVYVQMDMRVTDPSSNLVATVGADWWRDAGAPYLDDHSNNPGIGSTNWVELSTEWKTLAYYSVTTAQFRADLPPPLIGLAHTVVPAAPRITAFTPDTGTAGDALTEASSLTLTGTAESGSTISIFDGASQIGTARANESGAWSFATGPLSNATHDFSATAMDAAGNTSSTSSLLQIKVDATAGRPSPSTPSSTRGDGNLLIRGSHEAPSVTLADWAGLSGTHGSRRTAHIVAAQGNILDFDARPRPGFTGSTTTIEALCSDSLVLILLLGAIVKIGRNSSLDRLNGCSNSAK